MEINKEDLVSLNKTLQVMNDRKTADLEKAFKRIDDLENELADISGDYQNLEDEYSNLQEDKDYLDDRVYEVGQRSRRTN